MTSAVKAAITGGLKGGAGGPVFTAHRVVVTLPATPTPAPTASDSPTPTPSDSVPPTA